MNRQLLYGLGLLGFILLGSFKWQADKATSHSPSVDQSTDPPYITAIKEKIKGKENLPAEEVFENIQILKGMPAKKLLPIMQMGFSKSLGVQCTHCHQMDRWASEVKPTKQIAREMWNMTTTINKELLAKIDHLSSESPVVNCETCHRGHKKPLPNK